MKLAALWKLLRPAPGTRLVLRREATMERYVRLVMEAQERDDARRMWVELGTMPTKEPK